MWQDTVTGFLLAGVGNVDLRRKTNYLVVDNSKLLQFIVSLERGNLILMTFDVQ
jgi:vacuolar-type H+-ATPase subunit F/Vma7